MARSQTFLPSLQSLSGGYVNSIFVCSVPADEDKLVVRISPNVEQEPFIDREYEYVVMKELSTLGLIQPLYCRWGSFLSLAPS